MMLEIKCGLFWTPELLNMYVAPSFKANNFGKKKQHGYKYICESIAAVVAIMFVFNHEAAQWNNLSIIQNLFSPLSDQYYRTTHGQNLATFRFHQTPILQVGSIISVVPHVAKSFKTSKTPCFFLPFCPCVKKLS